MCIIFTLSSVIKFFENMVSAFLATSIQAINKAEKYLLSAKNSLKYKS